MKVPWESLFKIFKQSESSSKRALKSHITVSFFQYEWKSLDAVFLFFESLEDDPYVGRGEVGELAEVLCEAGAHNPQPEMDFKYT